MRYKSTYGEGGGGAKVYIEGADEIQTLRCI